MKILIVTQYFYPEQFRINDICIELKNRGHELTVLTGLPNYPEGELYDGYDDWNSRKVDDYHGIKVIRCNLRPRHRGTINLILNYLSFVRQANKCLRLIDSQFDVIYVYGVSPITMALPAIKIKKENNTPVYYYCCDLWPESVLGEQNGHKQISRSNLIFLIANMISKYVYQNADMIGCKCNEFIDYIHDICKISKDKMTLLYEHAEKTYLSVNDHPLSNGTIDFMFLGNIGRVQNCHQIIEATRGLIPNRAFKVHFVGDGSELDALKKTVALYHLEDVVLFHGKVSIEEVVKYYDFADVCLLTLSNKTATGLTPPAKLPGYMAASRAVIASINGAAKTIIEEAHCGLVVAAEDVEGLKRIMQKVIDNEVDLDLLGENGRTYFKNQFTLDKHIDKLEKQLQELCEV